ncbi:MAG: SCO family protein, partial [Lysobacterales bacterium]
MKFILSLMLLVVLQSCKQPTHWNASDVAGAMPDLEFTLTGPDGEQVKASSLRGKPLLLFFGFTNCPGVCPTTLARLSVLRKKLGPEAQDLR